MKAIILECEDIIEILNHLVAYGYEEIVIFSREDIGIERSYFVLNDISVTVLASFAGENTKNKLYKIKGSLCERFLLVYSKEITLYDLEAVVEHHLKSQGVATILQKNKRLCAVLCEEEVFEYLEKSATFEKDALLRACQDMEITLIE